MKRSLLSILLFPLLVNSQSVTDYERMISPDSLGLSVYALSADSMEGRETGHAGQKRAAAYLAGKYESMGIPPHGIRHYTDSSTSFSLFSSAGYFQNHPISIKSNKEKNLFVKDTQYLFGKDFIYPAFFKDTLVSISNLIFYGIGRKTPYADIFSSKMHVMRNIMLYNEAGSDPLEMLFLFSRFSPDVPASVMIVVPEYFINNYVMQGLELAYNNYLQRSFPIFFITEELARTIVGADQYDEVVGKIQRSGKLKTETVACKVRINLVDDTERLCGQNVLALIKGTDTTETLVITSHYDHLGKNDTAIYYGADDNASGTATVLEMARLFRKAEEDGLQPGRNILFMNVSGEEKGLLGSAYYTAHPTVPLDQTIANINIDMVGRVDDTYDSIGVRKYVYVIGSDRLSTDLHLINEMENMNGPMLTLDYRYNKPDDPNRFYKRSDHYNFAKKGIPAIFYFDGKHPDYHKPTDTPDKIDLELLAERTRLIFMTAWELVNRRDRIVVDKEDNE